MSEGVRFEDAVCKAQTDKAILVEIDGVEYWIPKSQIHDDSEVFDDGQHKEGALVITEWIAAQKGLG